MSRFRELVPQDEVGQTVPMLGTLALHGGTPVRAALLPYGRHVVDEEDIAAVSEALRSAWLTTGPRVAEFEQAMASTVGAAHAVAFSSGTAALHGAAFAANLGPGDEVITTPLTFCATANAVLYQGATPVFADVREDTLDIDVAETARRITPRTKAVFAVDFTGHPADLQGLLDLAQQHHLILVEDACHALGARYRGRPVGGISHMTVFSFHPVKHVATGEGGMVTTNDAGLAAKLRLFRNHGIGVEAAQRQSQAAWRYDMVELGYNYRLPDVACALGSSQLRKLPQNLERRRQLARDYGRAFAGLDVVRPPTTADDVEPAWHLYVVRLRLESLRAGRDEILAALRAENIGVNVHYIPVHTLQYYRQRFGYRGGEYPIAEAAHEASLTLPLFHGMSDGDASDVVAAVSKVTDYFRR